MDKNKGLSENGKRIAEAVRKITEKAEDPNGPLPLYEAVARRLLARYPDLPEVCALQYKGRPAYAWEIGDLAVVAAVPIRRLMDALTATGMPINLTMLIGAGGRYWSVSVGGAARGHTHMDPSLDVAVLRGATSYLNGLDAEDEKASRLLSASKRP